jgi:hypothetical protein
VTVAPTTPLFLGLFPMCHQLLGRFYFYKQLRYHKKRFARVSKDKRAYKKIIDKCEFFQRTAPLFGRVVIFDKHKKIFETRILKIEEDVETGKEFVTVPYGYLPKLPNTEPTIAGTEEQEEETEEEEENEDNTSNNRASHLQYYLSLHAEQA